MKFFYTIFAILFISFNTELKGQYFGDEGAKWSYKVISNANPDTLMIIESIGVQEIMGQDCNVLQRTNISACGASIDEINYVYYEDGIVFWYNEVLNDFTILYDFNAEAGDSWSLQIEECVILVEIESVSFESFNGELLKVLHPEPNTIFGSSRIIERLGREDFLFPSTSSQDCGVACEGPQIVEGLRCYEDDSFSYQSIDFEELCFQMPPPTQDTCDFLILVGDDVNIDLGDDFEIELLANIPLSNITNIVWTPEETLSCNDCFTPIATPIENTCYTVMVTDVFNCTLSDTICAFVQTTAIDNLNQSESIKLYPNPASDLISVYSDGPILSEIKVYDMLGRLVLTIPSQNSYLQNIQVAELNIGVYFIEVSLGNYFARQKFIKR